MSWLVSLSWAMGHLMNLWDCGCRDPKQSPLRMRLSTCEGDWEALMGTQETWTRGQKPEVYLQMWHQSATTKALAGPLAGRTPSASMSSHQASTMVWRKDPLPKPALACGWHVWPKALAKALATYGSSNLVARQQMWTRIQHLVSDYDLQAMKKSAVDKMKELNSDERQGEQVQGHSQSLSLILSHWQYCDIAPNLIKWISDPNVAWSCALFSGVWGLGQCSSNKHQKTCCVLMSGGLTILPQ